MNQKFQRCCNVPGPYRGPQNILTLAGLELCPSCCCTVTGKFQSNMAVRVRCLPGAGCLIHKLIIFMEEIFWWCLFNLMTVGGHYQSQTTNIEVNDCIVGHDYRWQSNTCNFEIIWTMWEDEVLEVIVVTSKVLSWRVSTMLYFMEHICMDLLKCSLSTLAGGIDWNITMSSSPGEVTLHEPDSRG